MLDGLKTAGNLNMQFTLRRLLLQAHSEKQMYLLSVGLILVIIKQKNIHVNELQIDSENTCFQKGCDIKGNVLKTAEYLSPVNQKAQGYSGLLPLIEESGNLFPFERSLFFFQIEPWERCDTWLLRVNLLGHRIKEQNSNIYVIFQSQDNKSETLYNNNVIYFKKY